MFGISFIELLVIFVVALLVLGPEKLPGAVRTGALWLGRAKRTFNNVKSEIEQQLNTDDIRRQLHNESILADIDKARKSADKLVKDTKKELDKTQDGIARAISSTTPSAAPVVISSADEGVPTGADNWPDSTPDRPAAPQPTANANTFFVPETATDGPPEELATEEPPATEPDSEQSAEPAKAPVQDVYNSPPTGRVTVTGKKLVAVETAPPKEPSGQKD